MPGNHNTGIGKSSKTDVLIVGAGPAGLMCAYALTRAGVSVRIVEKRDARVPAGHADGLQPRTLEVLKSYGLLNRATEEGCEVRLGAFYNPNPNKSGEIQLSARAPFFNHDSTLNARYPFAIALNQGSIEQIFLDGMQSMGLEVDRSTIPIAIDIDESSVEDPDAYPVKVTIQKAGVSEAEVVNAKYVVGADGAHSWVRQNMKIPVDGSPTPYVWGVLDMVPETDFPDFRNWAAIHSDNGTVMIIPRERDMIRIYVHLEGENAIEATKEGADGKRVKMSPEWILNIARKALHPYKIETPKSFEWSSIYSISQGIASRYSVRDRVFIAGDACHTHSPKAGQGLNASVNDTYNLAWKLVWVLRGWANRSLLKTYEAERREYARDLIDFDKKYAELFSEKPQNQSNLDGVMHSEFVSASLKSRNFTSGIGVQYFPSDIVDPKHQELASGIIVGERMPPETVIRLLDFTPLHIHDLLPSDTRFKLLIFAGNVSSSAQHTRLRQLSGKIKDIRSLFSRLATVPDDNGGGLEVLTVLRAKKDEASFSGVPLELRYHWSKVLVDDEDLTGTLGGQVHQKFGIRPEGAIVVVRPDGYVGTISSFEDFKHIEAYFSSFLRNIQ